MIKQKVNFNTKAGKKLFTQPNPQVEEVVESLKNILGDKNDLPPEFHQWANNTTKQLTDFFRQALSQQREAVIKEVLELINEVGKVNESNGRYNACQEIKKAIRDKYKI